MKKILRNIATIISIIISLIPIYVFFLMKIIYNRIPEANDFHTRLLKITSNYRTFIYGFIFLEIVWIGYILLCLSEKIYSKYTGLKRNLLFCLLILIMFILLLPNINVAYELIV